MRLLIFTIIILHFLCGIGYCFLPSPPILNNQPTQLVQYLQSLYDNHNKLEVVTSNPDGNRIGSYGQIVVYNNSGSYQLYTNTSTPSGTSWSLIQPSGYYGNMYADEASQLVIIGATNTYYQIGGSITGGLANGFTFQNSKELKCNNPGIYLITWSTSINPVNNNQDISGCIMKNGVAQTSTTNHSFGGSGASKNLSLSGNGIISLNINDLVSVAIANHTTATNITMEHLNFSIYKIG